MNHTKNAGFERCIDMIVDSYDKLPPEIGAVDRMPPPQRISPASELLGELIATQALTSDLVTQLFNIAEAALYPDPPAPGGSNGNPEPAPMRSPVCEAIQSRIDEARFTNTRLQRFIDRFTV